MTGPIPPDGANAGLLGLLHTWEARIEADTADTATGWVVRVHDPSTGRTTLHGPYADPATACARSLVVQAECDAEFGAGGMQVTVAAVLPDDWPGGAS